MSANFKNVIRGDSLEITFELEEDEDRSLDGAKLYYTCKKAITEPDSAAVLADTTVLSVGQRSVTFKFGPPSYEAKKDTTKLELGGEYFWDLQAKFTDGFVETISTGKLTVDKDSDYTQGAD